MKLSVILPVLVAVQITAFGQSNAKCSDMAKFKTPGVTLEITRAAAIPAGRAPAGRGGATGPMLPAHCRVDGMMDRRTGTDGKTYGIRFAVALPDNWTGEFLQQGGGGLNGTVGEPTGAQAAGINPLSLAASPWPRRIPAIRVPVAHLMGHSCRISKRHWTSNSLR